LRLRNQNMIAVIPLRQPSFGRKPMGLLDATPDDWLELYRRAAQDRSPNGGNADATYDPAPPGLPRSQPQRAPLSLAGPDLAASEPRPSAPVAPLMAP
jgi:hypothetical protein